MTREVDIYNQILLSLFISLYDGRLTTNATIGFFSLCALETKDEIKYTGGQIRKLQTSIYSPCVDTVNLISETRKLD